MNKEEQDYTKQLKAAFEEQKDVELRNLTMTKERYQQLAYTYCKITDEEEMKDFAYISTHENVRLYYLSDSNLAILDKISNIKFPKNPLKECVSHGRLNVNVNIPHSFKIDNLYELKKRPQSTLECIDSILSDLFRTILIWLSIALLIKLLSLPLDEIASVYLASNPL
jgi:hypothetical protein